MEFVTFIFFSFATFVRDIRIYTRNKINSENNVNLML